MMKRVWFMQGKWVGCHLVSMMISLVEMWRKWKGDRSGSLGLVGMDGLEKKVYKVRVRERDLRKIER